MPKPNKIIPYESHLKLLARQLRKNSTLSEVLLWNKIKNKAFGAEFHRQVPLRRYIVDFYCHAAMLVIECDGSQHHSTEGLAQDSARDCRLNSLGLQLLRFDNLQVINQLDAVCEVIAQAVSVALSRSGNPPDPL